MAGGAPSFTLLSEDQERDGEASAAVSPSSQTRLGQGESLAGRKSFADVLVSGTKEAVGCGVINAFRQPLPRTFDNLFDVSKRNIRSVGIKEVSEYEGRPCIYLSDDELNRLAKPLDLSLIGKFPQGRPKWVALNRFFMDLKLYGSYKIASIDARHFVIHLTNLEDYMRIFSRPVSTIKGYFVKYMKWSMQFDVNSEPSVTPVWISMPLLSMNMFTQEMLYSIAQVYGKPLLLDDATAWGNKPEKARVLVELDLLKEYPKEVWMGNRVNGFAQIVEIEKKPQYCEFCRRYGHMVNVCYKKDPSLDPFLNQGNKAHNNSEGTQKMDKSKDTEDIVNNQRNEGEIDGNAVSNEKRPVERIDEEEDAEAFWINYKKQMENEERAEDGGEHSVGRDGQESDGKRQLEKEHQKGKDREEVSESSMADGACLRDKEEEDFIYKNQVKEIFDLVTGIHSEDGFQNVFGDPNVGRNGASDPTLVQSSDETMVDNSLNIVENVADDMGPFKVDRCGWESQTPMEVMVEDEDVAATSVDETLVEPVVAVMVDNVEEEVLGQRMLQNLFIDTTLLTKVNVMDLDCMGFRNLGSKELDAENGMGGDKSVCPPHRKNRRQSWGEEVEAEMSCKRQYKKEKKKEHKLNKFSFGSPKKIRGKMREILAGTVLSAEDSP